MEINLQHLKNISKYVASLCLSYRIPLRKAHFLIKKDEIVCCKHLPFRPQVLENNKYYSSKDKLYTESVVNSIKQTDFTNKVPTISEPHSDSLSQRSVSLKDSPFLLNDDPEILCTQSIEKQIRDLMVMWQVRTAVDLLKAALKDGEKPDRQIIAGMLQQIAVLGEVDTLKELHEVLKVEELVTQVWFYKCLSDAYCNSGRLEEGITMLRQEYASDCNLEDVDMFFIMLTVKAITHFPHRLALIEDIINTQETERKLELCATYWLSFVLAEKFDTADTMLKDYLFLKKMISLQLSKLKRSSFEVDYNKDRVLVWLFQQPYINKGLRASLFDFFIVHKCRENEWDEALEHILSAMEQGKKVHKQTLQMFLSKFLSHMSKLKIEQLTDWVDKQKKIC